MPIARHHGLHGSVRRRIAEACVRETHFFQCDEIWSFVGSKGKNTSPEKKAEGCGDGWTRPGKCIGCATQTISKGS